MNREQQADMETKLGKYKEFNSISELIQDLHEVPFYCCPRCGLVFYPQSATDIHC